MKKNVLFILFLYTLTIYAQDPNILWQRTIGGSGSDKLWSIVQTSDGGFLVGGNSDSNTSGEKNEDSRGGDDYWVIRLNPNGNILWQRTFGGNADDYLFSVQQTIDGGFILGGHSNSNISGDKTENSQGDFDYWIIKLDNSGNIQWQNTIGGNGIDIINKIVETDEGNFLIGGHSTSAISGDRTVFKNGFRDVWLVKLDLNGGIIWQKSYGYNDVTLTGLAKTIDGGFILSSTIFGITPIHDAFWALRLDSFGNQIWSKIIGGDKSDWFPKINPTTDGGYIIAGASDSDAFGDKSENSQGSFDYWVVKLDENGNVVWENTIGGSEPEQPDSIIQCLDGSYLVCGYSSSNISGDKTQNSQGSSDYWFLKLNSVGIIEWQNRVGGEEADHRAKAIQAVDGSYVIGGYSSSNISGDKTENSRGEYDFWIVKHAASLGINENPFATTITLYPSPAKNTLQLNTQDKTIDQVNIYTMTGSKVLQLNVDTVSPTVDVSSLASGVYYLQLYSGKNVALKKFVKE